MLVREGVWYASKWGARVHGGVRGCKGKCKGGCKALQGGCKKGVAQRCVWRGGVGALVREDGLQQVQQVDVVVELAVQLLERA